MEMADVMATSAAEQACVREALDETLRRSIEPGTLEIESCCWQREKGCRAYLAEISYHAEPELQRRTLVSAKIYVYGNEIHIHIFDRHHIWTNSHLKFPKELI